MSVWGIFGLGKTISAPAAARIHGGGAFTRASVWLLKRACLTPDRLSVADQLVRKTVVLIGKAQ
jgi:hypothetical protein